MNLGQKIAFGAILEGISEDKLIRFISEANLTLPGGAEVDDGPDTWYNNLDHFKSDSEEMANKLGMKVLSYIFSDGDFNAFKQPEFVNPPTHFPSGIPGDETAVSGKDHKSQEAYAIWKAYIDKVATIAGYQLMNFDDSEEAEEPTTPQGEKVDEPLTEGVKDKSIFKCVFLAGGPGSGKSFVASKIFNEPGKVATKSLTTTGMKIVNLDQAYEFLKKKHGIPPNEADLTDEQRSMSGKLMAKSRKIAEKQLNNYLDGKLGIIVDGTGASSNALLTKKKMVEDLGYDTYMIFVETSLETALERNRNRKERSLLDKIVERTWQKVQDNLRTYKSAFGSNFALVNTDGDPQGLPKGTKENVMKFIKKPPQNAEAKRWIKLAKGL